MACVCMESIHMRIAVWKPCILMDIRACGDVAEMRAAVLCGGGSVVRMYVCRIGGLFVLLRRLLSRVT